MLSHIQSTKRIFITATNTDIGKTYTTELLLQKFASRGLRVGAIKPIETGVVAGNAPDGLALLKTLKALNPELSEITLEDIVPITYELPAAPFIASNNTPFNLLKVQKAIEKIEKLCDILLIEGAGGLYVPIDASTMMIDLIQALNAKALLVTHCSLGCINDTLLSQKALQAKNILHVIGFNCKAEDESFEYVSKPYFKEINMNIMKIEQDIDTLCDVLYNL